MGEKCLDSALPDECLKATAVFAWLSSRTSITERFNPVYVMEKVLPKFDEQFSFKVVACEDWFLMQTIPL